MHLSFYQCHFAVVCHTRVVRDVMTPSLSRDENKVNFLGAVTHVEESNNPWTVNLQIDETEIGFKIDKRADSSEISTDTLSALIYTPQLK